MKDHIHPYQFDSDMSNGHFHKVIGHTAGRIGIGSFHIHTFFGICSYMGHTHYYSGVTGFPAKTEKGHVHSMECMLETNNLHEHPAKGRTQEETAGQSDMLIREAYV